MKKTISLIALLLSAATLLCACGDTIPESPDTAETEEIEAVYECEIVKNGETQYKIVRADAAGDDLIQGCIALRRAIKEKFGAEMAIETDFELPTFDKSQRSEYEILIGDTNREESAEVKSTLGYLDWAIKLVGKRIVIVGGSDEATLAALNDFIECDIDGDELVIYSDYESTCTCEYDVQNAAIDGIPLGQYSIVYGTGLRNYAVELAKRLGKKTGFVMPICADNTEKAEHEIVISSKKRDTLKTYAGTDDYGIDVRDGSVYISGGSVTAVAMGCAALVELIEGGACTASALTLSYVLPDRQEYINDISKLSMRWALEFEPEDWLLDFNEKYAAMIDPEGRMISCIHRGDSNYYPENSIEGYISAIRMGADMLEIDPRLTKDGVFVIMHDATLIRTTDYGAKAGKNGLPTSPNLEDWTYAQLQQLNLKTGHGGDTATVTNFKIPTLDEAVHVAAGHVFIRLDVKGPATGGIYWDYEKDIWPLEQKYSSYDNILFTWHSVFSANNYSLVKKYKALQTEACGRSAVHIIACGASRSAREINNILKSTKFESIVRLTDVDWSAVGFDTYVKNNAAKLAEFKGKVRIYSDAQANGSNMQENAEWWDKLYSYGFSAILVNESVNFVRYIQENYYPAEY